MPGTDTGSIGLDEIIIMTEARQDEVRLATPAGYIPQSGAPICAQYVLKKLVSEGRQIDWKGISRQLAVQVSALAQSLSGEEFAALDYAISGGQPDTMKIGHLIGMTMRDETRSHSEG